MKRREFLTTSSGALCFSHLVRAEEHSFKGKIKKAVKFGTKPNEKQMQKLKDLGFDGIEGSGPGFKIEPMKMACRNLSCLCMGWFTINIGRLGCPIQIRRFAKKAESG